MERNRTAVFFVSYADFASLKSGKGFLPGGGGDDGDEGSAYASFDPTGILARERVMVLVLITLLLLILRRDGDGMVLLVENVMAPC